MNKNRNCIPDATKWYVLLQINFIIYVYYH